MRLTVSAGERRLRVHVCMRVKKVAEIDDIDLMDPELRSLRARIAAHAKWSKHDRRAHAQRMRELRLEKIAKEVDPDNTLPPDERAARIQSVLSEQASRAAYAKAQKQAVKKKGVASSAATGEATRETGVSALKTEQESQ